MGVTASGKSALAQQAAVVHGDLEIVNVDSMQVYRGMDVGTAKATAAQQSAVRHHAIDLVDPSDEYSVAAFQQEARHAIESIERRGHRALLVGGTALYLRAVVDDLDIPGRFAQVRDELEAEPDTAALHRRLIDLDPAAADRIDPGNRRRVVRALEVTLGSGRAFSSFGPGLDRHPPSDFRLLGVWLPRAVSRARIAARYQSQLAEGFLAECQELADLGPALSTTAGQALGYRELIGHLRGGGTLEEALAQAVRRTRRFARRQRMWFRRDPRISWLAHGSDPAALGRTVVGATAPGA